MKHLLLRFVKNKFTYLVVSLVILLIFAPLTEKLRFFQLPVMTFLFLLVIIAVLWTLNLKKKVFVSLVLAACALFILDVFSNPLVREGGFSLNEINLAFFCLFVFSALLVIILKIFQEQKVTIDTIQGGIAVYLLAGILWASLYQLFSLLNMTTFSGNISQFSDLIYYSFVTLTTLGYGDIVPTGSLGRTLASTEAVFGQLFLTIYVARLVGLHITSKARAN